MTDDPYLRLVPTWLEDEVIMLENAGEMPEVVLAESLHYLGSLPLEDQDILRAATVRGYLKIIRRDLDYTNVGLPPFRGLGRAGQNLARLSAFLRRLGWQLPPGAAADLAHRLAIFLEAERDALAQGRTYVVATREQVEALAGALSLDLTSYRELLERLDALPCPDSWGLRALHRLEAAPGQSKRRQEAQGKARLEVLDDKGHPLEAVEMPLCPVSDSEDPECRQRVETVWRLIPLPVS